MRGFGQGKVEGTVIRDIPDGSASLKWRYGTKAKATLVAARLGCDPLKQAQLGPSKFAGRGRASCRTGLGSSESERDVVRFSQGIVMG